MTPSLGGFLTPINLALSNGIQQVSASFSPVQKAEILNKIIGRGLRVESRFTRSPHLVSATMVNLELTFTNEGSEQIKNIRTGNKTLPSGMSVHEFAPVPILQPNMTVSSTLGINYNDSTQPAKFNIDFTINEETHSVPVSVKAPIGEIIRSVVLPESMFVAEKDKLKGMNEHNTKLPYVGDGKDIAQRVLEVANLAVVSIDASLLRFAAQTLASKSLILVSIKFIDSQQMEVCVNCEKMVIGSMLLNEIKVHLQ